MGGGMGYKWDYHEERIPPSDNRSYARVIMLTIELGEDHNLRWAQETVTAHHYLHQPVDPRARPMVYVIRHEGFRVGLVMLGIPHATRCTGWWGYEGLPTQWQVVDLCRIWLHPDVQRGGYWCEPGEVPGYVDRKGTWRPAVASWAIAEVLGRVQADRVRLWPPVFTSQPYHIELAISYHDPQYHKGTIYREAKAAPMYRHADGSPKIGPSGKYGWCWPLPRPAWSWSELDNIKPRTMRLF